MRYGFFRFLPLLLCACTLIYTMAVQATTRQRAFIDRLLPVVKQANATVADDRERLLQLFTAQETGKPLSNASQSWLQHLAARYHVADFSVNDISSWTRLIKRVDVVPTSLVIAQAINESAWGQSRFAKEANNLFGQQCRTEGCGLVPAARPDGATYEVKTFPTIAGSIKSYINNLNTNRAYQKLRELRFQEREHNTPLNSLTLAKGLLSYSEIGHDYVESLQAIIQKYHLREFDR